MSDHSATTRPIFPTRSSSFARLVLGYITTVPIEQNDIFKVLTIASVVGVPPTLHRRIWGMNFKFICRS